MKLFLLVLAAFINGQVELAVKSKPDGTPWTYKSKEDCEVDKVQDQKELATILPGPFELQCLTEKEFTGTENKSKEKDV